MIVVKRDGRNVNFNEQNIINSIKNAGKDVNINLTSEQIIKTLYTIQNKIQNKEKINIEKLQDIIESSLYINGLRKIRESYSNYRKDRTTIRDFKSELMHVIDKIGIETDRDNANVGNNFSSKLLRIASESNKWHMLATIPKHIAKAHENGILYQHDLDSYNLTTNCLHVETGKILKRGFNTGYGTINPPKRIESAAELSCILLQSTQNDMFGGQSHVNFDNDMADFINITRQEIYKEYSSLMHNEPEEKIKSQTENKLYKTIHQSMQGIVYNLNTMHSRAGSQVPFSSINIGIPKNEDAALICKIFLEEYRNGLGKNEQPIFPNIIFRVKKGVNKEPNDPYYYLFELACLVASERMNPTFMNLDADFNKKYYDKGILPATMGCRTYVCSNVNGDEGPDGRGNIAPTTISLPRLGLASKFDCLLAAGETNVENKERKINKFFELLDKYLDLARESLLYRHNVLKKLKVKDLPFVAGQGLMKGSENLNHDDSIEPILKNGSYAIGFIGLAEALIALTGYHHGENIESYVLGLRIIKHIRNYCDKYTQIDKLNYSCYATPAEGLCGKLISIDKEKYGEIKGITDKDFYTNSYHIPVYYKIPIKDKIDIEAPFHKLCNGGHITYIELDGYPKQNDIKNIINYAYNNTNINYIAINFHMRYCKSCGQRIEQHEYVCSNCGSNNIQGVSRVTGYLSLDERFGIGKTAERSNRISHENGEKIYV